MVGAFFEAAIQVGARKPGSDAEDIVLVACSVFARETALHSAEKQCHSGGLQLRRARFTPVFFEGSQMLGGQARAGAPPRGHHRNGIVTKTGQRA